MAYKKENGNFYGLLLDNGNDLWHDGDGKFSFSRTEYSRQEIDLKVICLEDECLR